jgi:predicted TIM-barrel fold metal-dependent hydrolase
MPSAPQDRVWDPRGGPDPDTRKPGFILPPDTCDCHVHVFGPATEFPFSPANAERGFNAPKEDLHVMHRTLGIGRCVVVHGGSHGTDLSVTLDALATSARPMRAVALVDDNISDARLEELHAAGFRGIRYSPAMSGVPLETGAVRHMADRLTAFGWHILFHFKGEMILDYAELLNGLKVPCVLDHFAGIDPAAGGTGQAAFRMLVRLLGDGGVWVKTSGIDRISNQGYPFADAADLARALVTAAPDRVIWGTDWPHPGIGPQGPTNDGDLVDLIPTYVDDPVWQRKLLVDNPARLYGFD